ncbi:hypothetical protein MTO96_027718 [Rhipicephalus appendiculatus]
MLPTIAFLGIPRDTSLSSIQVPVMQEVDKHSLMTIAITMVTHVELKLTKDQPGWRDVTFETRGVLAYGTNILYLPVHLVNSEFVGDERIDLLQERRVQLSHGRDDERSVEPTGRVYSARIPGLQARS